MQQEITPGNVERQDVDIVLASYGQRVGAWAVDFVGSILTKFVLVFVFFALFLRIVLSGPGSAFAVPDWPVTVLAIAAVVAGAGIGYIVWWLLVLGRGQTPDKQLVGIRVFKDNGKPSGWHDNVPGRRLDSLVSVLSTASLHFIFPDSKFCELYFMPKVSQGKRLESVSCVFQIKVGPA